MQTQLIDKVKVALEGSSGLESLHILADICLGEVAFSTSFGYEDQLITHEIFSNDLPIRVFTLDTGRMFPETYRVWSGTLDRYKLPIEVYSPKEELLEPMLQKKGPNSFYNSLEDRKECCYLRKVEPLRRALDGAKIWVTGIRADQSGNRTGMEWIEWDEVHQLVKVHPLFNYSIEQVKSHISMHNIPYNVLHDKGFPSIGCAPCTRAVQPGEDFRAGRWWWEDNSKKECGLHQTTT